jgi:hypothetical protein
LNFFRGGNINGKVLEAPGVLGASLGWDGLGMALKTQFNLGQRPIGFQADGFRIAIIPSVLLTPHFGPAFLV